MRVKTIISVSLLLILAFFTFMGRLYSTLGDAVGAIIWAILCVIIMGLMLFGAAYARKHQGSFSKALHCVGYGLGLVYFVLGLLFMVPSASHFFYVNSEKHNIQVQADTVIARTNEMFKAYKKQTENRALRLETEIKNTQYTSAGWELFSKAFPGKKYSASLPGTERSTFLDVLLLPYNQNFPEWDQALESEFVDKLVNGWSLFYSPSNCNLLANKVKSYSKELREGFTKLSPMERVQGESPEFNISVNADLMANKFKNNESSPVWSAILIIVLLLSCAEFVFIQLPHVRKRKKKDPIYEQGFTL